MRRARFIIRARRFFSLPATDYWLLATLLVLVDELLHAVGRALVAVLVVGADPLAEGGVGLGELGLAVGEGDGPRVGVDDPVERGLGLLRRGRLVGRRGDYGPLGALLVDVVQQVAQEEVDGGVGRVQPDGLLQQRD